MLLVVSGLPGLGKTSVAREVARRLEAVHLSVDPVEDAMLACGLPRSRATGIAAYETLRAMAETNLELGRIVVVDAVNDSEAARDTWRRAAAATGREVCFVQLTIEDDDVHRARLEGRPRRFQHVDEPSWHDVLARARDAEPWVEPPTVADASRDLAQVVEEVVIAFTE